MLLLLVKPNVLRVSLNNQTALMWEVTLCIQFLLQSYIHSLSLAKMNQMIHHLNPHFLV